MSPDETRQFEPPQHSLAITFAPNQDPEDWEASYSVGETSSRWPYGLDLQSDRFTVRASVRSRPSTSDLGRFLARTVAARASCRSPGAVGYAFAWDENLAIRSLLAHRGRRQISGLIWATQEADSRLAAVKRALNRLALRQVDGIFVLSSAQVEAARRWLGSPSIPIVFIPMAVNVDFFRPTPFPVAPFVFSMGNDKHRDPGLLAEAMAQVVASNPAAQVLVQTNRPEMFSREIETVDRLSTGDVLRFYGRASVVAIATRPNDHVSGITVALEAMASGRPVVMSAAPGLEDYIVDGATGYLVPQGDAAGFADRVNALLNDPMLGEAMGTAARTRVETDFSLEVMNASIGKFIASIPLNG